MNYILKQYLKIKMCETLQQKNGFSAFLMEYGPDIYN